MLMTTSQFIVLSIDKLVGNIDIDSRTLKLNHCEFAILFEFIILLLFCEVICWFTLPKSLGFFCML